MDEQQNEKAAEDQRLHFMAVKSTAVRQAMFEIIGEQRDEIVKRARAKLVALGIDVSAEEVEAGL